MKRISTLIEYFGLLQQGRYEYYELRKPWPMDGPYIEDFGLHSTVGYGRWSNQISSILIWYVKWWTELEAKIMIPLWSMRATVSGTRTSLRTNEEAFSSNFENAAMRVSGVAYQTHTTT